MKSNFVVEVRDPEGQVPTRPASPPLASRIDELADAVVSATTSIRAHLDHGVPDDLRWNVDTVEITFQLDLRADAGVVLTRAGDQHALSVKCTYKRRT